MLRFKWQKQISGTTDKQYENVSDIEKIPEGWEHKNIGQVAELRREHFFPKDEDVRLYVGLEHIEEGTLSLKSLGKSNDVVSSKSVFKKGDILFGKLRPYFRKVILAPFDGVCSTDILVIKPKTKTHNRYLFYLLASKQIIDSVSTASEGTKMPRTSWGFLESIEINVPPYEEQNRIGEVLSWFDGLIENKKRQNDFLEKSAMAIFKSWFIDFEPFSENEFVDSALGKIPKEWDVKELQKAMEFLYGKGLPENKREEGPFPVVGSSGIVGSHSENLVSAPSIVVGRKGNAGSVYLMLEPCFPIDTVFYSSDGTPSEVIFYIYHFLRTASLVDVGLSDTAVPGLNIHILNAVKVLLPPQPILEKFRYLIEPLLKKMFLNEKQISVLARVRDALLPLLVFGELRMEEI